MFLSVSLLGNSVAEDTAIIEKTKNGHFIRGNPNQIYFVRDNAIWSMYPDGTNQILITEGTPGYWMSEPVISPDGTKIVYLESRYIHLEKDYGYEYESILWLLDLDTKKKRFLKNFDKPIGSPSWMPNGKEVFFVKFGSTERLESQLYKIE